jgi:hypothetical protein
VAFFLGGHGLAWLTQKIGDVISMSLGLVFVGWYCIDRYVISSVWSEVMMKVYG